jgi:hypothetical protein
VVVEGALVVSKTDCIMRVRHVLAVERMELQEFPSVVRPEACRLED